MDKRVKEVFEYVNLSEDKANTIFKEILKMVDASEEKYDGSIYTYELLKDTMEKYTDVNEQKMAIYTLGIIVGSYMTAVKCGKHKLSKQI